MVRLRISVGGLDALSRFSLTLVDRQGFGQRPGLHPEIAGNQAVVHKLKYAISIVERRPPSMALPCAWAIKYEWWLGGVSIAARFHQDQVRCSKIVNFLELESPARCICLYTSAICKYCIITQYRWLILSEAKRSNGGREKSAQKHFLVHAKISAERPGGSSQSRTGSYIF